MSVFNFENYKPFVREKIAAMPLRGRGEFQRMAASMQMHTTTVSQVFRGEKDLTLEQAAKLCRHWGLTSTESDYFLNLVELERSGADELKDIVRDRLKRLRDQSHDLSNRVPKDRVLSADDRNRFYSSWMYSAIRLLCDIPEFQNPDRIADRLGLPPSLVNDSLQFLLSKGLVEQKGGNLKLGAQRTYLEASSPLIARHHSNWRIKAMERYEKIDAKRDLVFTSPMTVAKKDAQVIREKIAVFIQEIMKLNADSESEALHFLNIDWLEL